MMLLPAFLACGHGEGGGDIWDFRVQTFADARCRNSCVPVEQQDDCVLSTIQQFDSNRQFLGGASAEAVCIACMRTQTDLLPAIAAGGCEPSDAQLQQILATCDPDKTFDSNFDGDPANDINEACEPQMFPDDGGGDDEPPSFPDAGML